MKKLLFLTAVLLATTVCAQKNTIDKKYGIGTVPVKEGKVEFSEDYKLADKSKAQIYQALHNFALGLTKSENALPQCHVTASDEANQPHTFLLSTAFPNKRRRIYRNFAQY